jgi:hypothetical protein
MGFLWLARAAIARSIVRVRSRTDLPEKGGVSVTMTDIEEKVGEYFFLFPAKSEI